MPTTAPQETLELAEDVAGQALGAAPCSAFDALVNAIEKLNNDDWEKIYEATRPRLLAVEFDGEDTGSNRVLCEMTITNAIFDMRDFRNRTNDSSSATPCKETHE